MNYYHGELVGGRAPEVPPRAGDAPTDRAGRLAVPVRRTASTGYERGLPRTPMNWEVAARGADPRSSSASRTSTRRPPAVSLYVTENGAAYDDERVVEDGDVRVHDDERVEFLRGHLGAILDAIDAGVDVRGYFYWSLLDNFEWAWGYEKRFGIVRVDYDTQERTSRTAAGNTLGSSASARST